VLRVEFGIQDRVIQFSSSPRFPLLGANACHRRDVRFLRQPIVRAAIGNSNEN